MNIYRISNFLLAFCDSFLKFAKRNGFQSFSPIYLILFFAIFKIFPNFICNFSTFFRESKMSLPVNFGTALIKLKLEECPPGSYRKDNYNAQKFNIIRINIKIHNNSKFVLFLTRSRSARGSICSGIEWGISNVTVI